jgi:hypothetical protein
VISRAGLVAVAGLALVAGCLEESDLPVEAATAPIIGGIEDLGHPNVVMLTSSTGLCTGTLVAPRVVLTAAHCVDTAGGATVLFGSSADDPEAISVSAPQIVFHRYYDPTQIGSGLPFDIAMVRLSEPAPAGIEPMEMNLEPLSQDLVGTTMLAVGFGANNGAAQTGFGVKRRVDLPIETIGALLIGSGNDDKNTCQGDSGGPGILVFDGIEHVAGITSTGPAGCGGVAHQTRVDIYRDEFIIPILDAWDGPCQQDGTCVEDGCRTPDPDCDPCSVDAFCATNCPKLDLDCPVVGFAGDLCGKNDDCESRYCIAAHDDPRVKYCSSPCDPGGSIEDECAPPLGQCAAFNGDEPSCHYTGITPSSQGADCESGADCRSSVCDPDHAICIEQCGDGLPECPDEYSCESFGNGVRACTFPPGGCGCVVGARNRGNAGGLVGLGLLAIFALRRRAKARLS